MIKIKAMKNQLDWIITKLIIRKYRLLMTLLILTAINVADGSCPEKCVCYLNQRPKTINCSQRGFHIFPENISDVAEHLDLSENIIIEISNDINRFKDLQVLNLANNKLTHLPRNLSGLNNLERLDLTGNQIKDMTAISTIKLLSRITYLALSNNPISNFEGLENDILEMLYVDDCDIKEVTNTSLSGLPSLMSLSLVRNPLRDFEKPTSRSLTSLNLSGCNLQELNPDTFENLPKLSILILTNNSKLIYSTGSKTLSHNNLKILDVSQCNLDRPGIHGFPQLTYAKLSNNKIKKLPNGVFSRNRELQFLFLNGNNLNYAEERSFARLSKLQILDLSTNGLQGIHWSAFRENSHLKLLNLSNNNLTNIYNLTTFSISLDLSNNLFSSFDQNKVANICRTKSLNLSYNCLKDFPRDLQSDTLEILNLKHNKINKINKDSLTGLPELQNLDLSGNQLVQPINTELFRNNPNMKFVNFEDNPWNCDCKELFPIFEYLSNLSDNLPTSSLLCYTPRNASGYSWKTACHLKWALNESNNRAWDLILISIITLIVIFCSIITIRYTIRMKRLARNRRREMERNEIRNRLRLLQRRNQHFEEELISYSSEPRIHPLELTGPPSYEEAVHMARLAHSLDTLNSITAENASITRVIGSVDNLRLKKRRSRRSRKRAQSEDSLTRREMRQEGRLRQRGEEGRRKTTKLIRRNGDLDYSSEPASELLRSISLKTETINNGSSENVNSSSNFNKNHPPTPSMKKRRRSRLPPVNGTSTDDEDSDIEIINRRQSDDIMVVVKHLRREPRSGRSNIQDNIES